MPEERWRKIPWFDGYLVSDQGRVVNSRTKRLLKPQPAGAGGHVRVSLRRGGETFRRSVHQLVLLAFVGPCPKGKEGLHYDDDPLRNDLENLRWGTRSENRQDRERNRGRLADDDGKALNAGKVQVIKRALKAGASHERLGRLYGVDRSTIGKISRGEIWSHVL